MTKLLESGYGTGDPHELIMHMHVCEDRFKAKRTFNCLCRKDSCPCSRNCHATACRTRYCSQEMPNQEPSQTPTESTIFRRLGMPTKRVYEACESTDKM